MADTTEKPERKKSKLPLIAGLVLLIAGGAGGYVATTGGLLSHDAKEDHSEKAASHATEKGDSDQSLANIAFIPMDPLLVSLGPDAESRHLRFRAELEVPATEKASVEKLMPRVVDVLNSYLQAIDESDVSSKAALLQLRAHMLHRVKLVVGADRVNDLLVMEFVLN